MPTIINIIIIIINLGIIAYWIFYWIGVYKENKLEKRRAIERQKRHDIEMENHIKDVTYWDNYIKELLESKNKEEIK